MSWISGALNLVSTGISAYSQWKQGQDAKDVYDTNAAFAQYQSEYIKEAAAIELRALEKDVFGYVSRQRALQGKSGTVPDVGSNADVIDQTLREGDLDAAIIRWRAGKEVEMSDAGADLFSKQGSQFQTAGNINAATTLLGGLSKWDWKTSNTYKPFESKPYGMQQFRFPGRNP